MFSASEQEKLPLLSPEMRPRLIVEDLHAYFGEMEILKGINLAIPDRDITAIIGPSGCGKSTFIRCLNRMHELTPGARVTGRVLLDGYDIYNTKVNPVRVRQRIGLVFQKPNPFPTMSVRQNVLAGLRLQGLKPRQPDEIVENALKQAALWEEVKDRLDSPGGDLSGGQQQRLCIARALALQPEVLLLDEPCSALDPASTFRIEQLLLSLKEHYTIVIVTHNLSQAARVATYTGFFLMGELIEFGLTEKLFETPQDKRTDDYIRGRFG